MGRGPAALKAAIELNAEAVVFGCGGAKAGHRAYAPDMIHGELVRRAGELGRFQAFHQDEGAQARAVLFERSWFVPGACGSTLGELRGVLPALEEAGIARLALVSSPDHLPRVMRDARTVFAGSAIASLMGYAADTDFASEPPVVIEEPHRPDRPGYSLRQVCADLLAVPADARGEVLVEVERVLQDQRMRGAGPGDRSGLAEHAGLTGGCAGTGLAG
ncbi:hypothetical protein CKO28_01110 [Rhodovibrio sodomensis]|uniref:DUF218 domain-containing protein n=1 Tax=Rhodovibrio sodomensis TaxID=1088 RepID=A0ABS1D8A7_9PROT|nr:hypothetical protein [Rhodovibrio sodomensis]MBK1666642.1 hypothetical protein [Rhodovibrio sodomensis]